MSLENSIFYTTQPIFSYKRLYNFICGVRGHGKTYDTTRICIEIGLKYKRLSFVVLCRYIEDFKDMKEGWWEIVEHLFPEYSFSTIGKIIYASNGLEKFPIGEFICLSSYVRAKKKPRPYVKMIVFDECLNEDCDYLDNEINKFLSVCDSIIRNRDDVRVVLISNTISVINPYFNYFGITKLEKRFTKGLHNSIVEFTDSEDFIKYRKQTKFGASITDTSYGNFAIKGQFILDDMTNVLKKPNSPTHILYNIVLNGLNIQVSMVNNLLYFSLSKDETRRSFTPYVEDAKTGNAMYCDKTFRHFKNIKKYFLHNLVLYETLKIKNEIIMFMQFLMGGTYK